MCDSNEIREHTMEKSNINSKSSSLILKELLIEYEEKLYSIKIELKTQQTLLKQYENDYYHFHFF